MHSRETIKGAIKTEFEETPIDAVSFFEKSSSTVYVRISTVGLDDIDCEIHVETALKTVEKRYEAAFEHKQSLIDSELYRIHFSPSSSTSSCVGIVE